MKRRFAVTLLAVAIAVLSAQAFAMAPVITYVPSPVIADDAPATSARLFVYPDALSLNTLATDDTVSSGAIIWSYTDAGRYSINNRAPLNLATDDPNNPGTKQVGGAGLDDPDSVDSDVRTATFRDTTLSPVGGPNVDPAPGDASVSIVGNEVVTLFASDGSTYSMKQVMVYTENNGTDRLSGGYSVTSVMNVTPTQNGTLGWTTTTIGGITPTTFSDVGNGLCLQVVTNAAGAFGGFVSPYNYISLVQNNVYRIRLSINASGATLPAGTTPFWDIVVDNYNTAVPDAADNKYSADLTILDNEGGANSVGLASSVGRNSFDLWYTPASVLAADWNNAATGEFTAANDSRNDMRMLFRINDVANGANNAALDAGTLCLSNIDVARVPITDIPVSKNLYDQSNLTASNFTVAAIFGVNGTGQTNAAFSGGNLTVTPNTSSSAGTGAWNLEVVNINPGDATADVSQPSTLPDNYPLVWESNKLLMGTVTAQAPDATGQSNPPDALVFYFDTPTSELSCSSTLSGAANLLGMPQTATATNYVVFFATNNKSVTPIVNGASLRLGAQLLLTQSINSGNSATNLGGITYTHFKVDEMVPPAN